VKQPARGLRMLAWAGWRFGQAVGFTKWITHYNEAVIKGYGNELINDLLPRVSQRLWMGEESRVLKAIRLVKESRDGKLNRLKQRLLKGMIDGGEKEKQVGE
jgi:hypothetical protein